MASKNKNLDTKINVCYMAYKPTVTESDVDDLVSFIVIVAQYLLHVVKRKIFYQAIAKSSVLLLSS